MSLPTIDTVPEAVTPAGQGYGYPDPPAFATIDMVNIPTDPDHQNAGINQAAYDAFIDAQIAATSDPTTPGGAAWTMQAQLLNDPEYSPVFEIDYDTAARLYNYGRITFPGGRRWYVFYTPVYVNPNATRFRADIDEFPSFDWALGYSMIERGHAAVAASQNDTYGSEFLTAPEPIDAPPVRGVLDAALLGAAPDAWTVLVISANDLRGIGTQPFWETHQNSDKIASAARLAESATINSAGAVQTTIDNATYPWSSGTPTPPSGEPANGYVPDDLLAVLPTAVGPNPARAELNTANAWAGVYVNYGGTIAATVSGAPASPAGYWDHSLDVAIHANPSLYGITDPDIAPIGESAHGLGIRINVNGVTAAQMATFGFSRFNDYTYTFEGPYSWDEVIPGDLQVFVPSPYPSPVSTIDGVPTGGGCYLFTMEGFAEYATIMQGAPWITAGISDIRLVPSWAVSGGGDAAYTGVIPSQDPNDPMWPAAAAIPVYREKVISATAAPSVLSAWRAEAFSATGIAPQWKKLLTSQFTNILVGNGESMSDFRPDEWQTSDIEFVAVTGAAHGDPSIRLIPVGYNELGSQMGIDAPTGGHAGVARTGYALAASNTAQAVMGPFQAAYSNDASWQAQFRQRELAQTLGLTNVQMNLGAAGVAAIFGGGAGATLGGAAGGGAGAAEVGGLLGAAGGAAAGAASEPSALMQASIQASNTIQLLAIETDGSFDIGAYQLGIAGEASLFQFQAWVQSLDSASGSGSPDSLASAWRAILGQAFNVIIAMPTAERIAALVSTWERYGYMIGQAFTPSQLNTMSRFTYWQTDGALITGSTPQEKRQTIAQAFDRGVTLWNDLADIGTDVTADNTPVTGFTY